MIEFWQNFPHSTSPIAFSVGFLEIRWYSLSYLLAFLTIYLLLCLETKSQSNNPFSSNKKTSLALLDSFFLWSVFGLLLGARLGYVLFYGLSDFSDQPLQYLIPFSNGKFIGFSGMSFHGGLLGIILSSIFFVQKHKLNFWSLSDFVIPAIPLGYFWGRMGNFLNGELYGRTTDFFLGMNFPLAPGNSLRHPSQLYEAFFEGIIIFTILWPLRRHSQLKHKILPLYLILYGVIRFSIEFIREPDVGMSLILGLTRGQLLSSVMILIGMLMLKFPTHLISNSPNKMSKL